MNKKKILIVSRSFYPQNSPRSFRTTELAKEFARQGHEVTVLTPKNQEVHPAFEKEHGLTIKNLGQPKWKSPDFGKSKIGYFLTRAAYRFLSLGFEYPSIELMFLVNKALKKEKNYDLLISIAVPYPIHWGVAKARTKKHQIAKIWVADCGDPFMGRENDTFKVPFYFKYVEKWFMRKADFVSVPTEGAVSAYFPEFKEKIRIIPQGFRFEDVEISRQHLKNPIPVFGYAGIFIPGRRDPAEFLDYILSLPIEFEFHIYTKTPRFVNSFLSKGKGRLFIHKPLPRNDVLFELSKMDFVVNFENAGNKQTPSKLIDYAIINKPILSIKTGAIPQKTIDEFLMGNYSSRYVIENPDQYRIENVCRHFISLTKANQ